MIIVPRHNLYLPERRWGQRQFQRGIICATAIFGGGAAGPSVIVAPTKLILDFEISGTAIAQVKVDSDGSLYENDGGGFSSYEVWLDSGSNTQVWVERIIISGSLTVDAGSGRLACTADRIFGVQQVGSGSKVAVIDLDFYDASSGGSLLDTQEVTLDTTVL